MSENDSFLVAIHNDSRKTRLLALHGFEFTLKLKQFVITSLQNITENCAYHCCCELILLVKIFVITSLQNVTKNFANPSCCELILSVIIK